MTWEEAIVQVLRENGTPMKRFDIVDEIMAKGYVQTKARAIYPAASPHFDKLLKDGIIIYADGKKGVYILP